MVARFVDVFYEPLQVVLTRIRDDDTFDWSEAVGLPVDVVTSVDVALKTPMTTALLQFLLLDNDSIEVGLGDYGGVKDNGVKQASRGLSLTYRVVVVTDHATGGDVGARKLSSMLERFFFQNQAYFQLQGLNRLRFTGGMVMDWAEEGFTAYMHSLNFYVEHDRVLV